jgi:hypothetical protein
VTLNSFEIGSLRWHKKLEDHVKFQNFQGCKLIFEDTFGVFLNFMNRNHEVLDCFRSKDMLLCNSLIYDLFKTEEPQGLFVELFKILSKLTNFTAFIQLEFPDELKTRYNIIEQYPIVKFKLNAFYHEIGSLTKLYFDSNFLLAATPSEFYSDYEKLWLPFDDFTWILLLLTFLAAFLVIFVAKYVTNSVKSLIIGREVLTPALNVLQVFFGISQMKLPAASVPRFILMMFIFFCLIFRTCYQSKLFEFMSSDMRKPPPKTITDLIDRNYQILTCDQGHLHQLLKHGNDKGTRYISILNVS